MHRSQCSTVRYDVFAVVFFDDQHYKALIIDVTGGKWTSDSMSPRPNQGKLMYHDSTPFGVRDKHICGDTYSARMVYYTKRVATESVPLESDVVDLTEDDNAADVDSDELESPG